MQKYLNSLSKNKRTDDNNGAVALKFIQFIHRNVFADCSWGIKNCNNNKKLKKIIWGSVAEEKQNKIKDDKSLMNTQYNFCKMP